jgi:hypothetical protein
MKSIFHLVVILISTNLLAQDLDYSKYRYFEEDKELQMFFYSSELINNQIVSSARDAFDNQSIAYTTLDFDKKTAEHKFYKSFRPFHLSINTVIDGKTYCISNEMKGGNLNTILHVFEENETTGEYDNTEFILDSTAIKSKPSAIFVINERILYVSFEAETQSSNDREFTIRIYAANKNEYTLDLLKTSVVDIREINDLVRVTSVGYNKNLMYWQLAGVSRRDGILLKFNAQDFTTEKLPLHNEFGLLRSSTGTSSNSIVNDTSFILSSIISNPETSKKKLVLSGYNTNKSQWIYNNEDTVLEEDSLTFGDSKIFNNTFNQLPNGDYITTASIFEVTLTDWHINKTGYQRTLLQVISNEGKPKIKAAYFYELPDGSNILSSIIQPDSTILLIGYSQDDDGVFSTLYLNIGKGPGAVGVNENEPQTAIKYSLQNDGQNLRLFNTQLSQVEIYDEWGRLLINKNGDEQRIDISSLSSGLYILRTKNRGETTFRMTNFVKP